jgi:hypothetical protein
MGFLIKKVKTNLYYPAVAQWQPFSLKRKGLHPKRKTIRMGIAGPL